MGHDLFLYIANTEYFVSKFVDNIGHKFSFFILIVYRGVNKLFLKGLEPLESEGNLKSIPFDHITIEGKTGTQRKEMPFQNYIELQTELGLKYLAEHL